MGKGASDRGRRYVRYRFTARAEPRRGLCLCSVPPAVSEPQTRWPANWSALCAVPVGLPDNSQWTQCPLFHLCHCRGATATCRPLQAQESWSVHTTLLFALICPLSPKNPFFTELSAMHCGDPLLTGCCFLPQKATPSPSTGAKRRGRPKKEVSCSSSNKQCSISAPVGETTPPPNSIMIGMSVCRAKLHFPNSPARPLPPWQVLSTHHSHFSSRNLSKSRPGFVGKSQPDKSSLKPCPRSKGYTTDY